MVAQACNLAEKVEEQKRLQLEEVDAHLIEICLVEVYLVWGIAVFRSLWRTASTILILDCGYMERLSDAACSTVDSGCDLRRAEAAYICPCCSDELKAGVSLQVSYEV